ncbi:MAG TPA: twin-arginine translocation signal domain-containing protein [Algoriphagus sp.]|nr:twin-arginine translocation signal domain-containing protein [Algoriphagus sp.]
MEPNTNNSRRNFLGALALGTAAGSLSAFTSPLVNPMDSNSESMHEADKWFEGIKGTHRVVYDGSTPHDGFPIIWNWAFYLTNNETGVKDEDMTAMTVLRHSAIPFALQSSMWEKYKLGEFFSINDNSTKAPSLRNPYYEPKEGDFPLPVIQGIKDLQARGAMFCVCNLALKVYSGFVAQGSGLKAEDVNKDWLGAVLPGIQVVPSGVWALSRAQKAGCGYIFAGG